MPIATNVKQKSNNSSNLLKMIHQSSKALLSAYNDKSASYCTSFYEQIAIIECDDQKLFMGTNEIFLFWKTFLNKQLGQAAFYGLKYDFISLSSISTTSEWLLADKSRVRFDETWTIQSGDQVLIAQQAIKLIPAQ